MYYAHFGLKEPPFKITPNTEFFFTGANRGAVLDALIYAIINGEGIVKVVGEVGSGKTMLCRMLQTLLPNTVESIFLANPSVAPEHVLYAIAFELQLKIPKNADRLKVMQMLQSHLVERHAAGKQVVVFVEEAQSMPLATLEEIRLLSNLETKHDKLLQIVLFGQPELDINLNQSNIRQLRERITHSFNLGPLNSKEIDEYLIFRLRAAGYFGPPLFTKAAIKKISASAQGLVRRVNILADKSLLATFADNVYLVSSKHVKAAINDSEFGANTSDARKKKLFLLVGGFTLIAVLTLGILVSQSTWFETFYFANLIEKVKKNTINQTVVKNQLVNKTKYSPKVTIKDSNVIKKVNVPANLAVMPTPVSATLNKKVEAIQPPVTIPALLLASKSDLDRSLLNSRLQVTSVWLLAQTPETVTIQLMGVSNQAHLETELVSLAQKIELDNIYVYRTKAKNDLKVDEPYFSVLYGGFANRQEAIEEMQTLPSSMQKNQPQLRTIAGILLEIQ